MESRPVKQLAVTMALLGPMMNTAWAGDPPCDKYPAPKQARCAEIWSALNKEDGPVIARSGLDQLKRRENGELTAEQHLAQNVEFIKQSTEKRLAKLKERMARE